MNSLRVILIGGPTASGKSSLALDIARQERGVIINADAMQVYEGLPILTAQPEETAKREIPHLLYGVFDPSLPSSVARWLDEARRSISEAHQECRTPILVGGTGLYFRALEQGIADIPEIPPSVRLETRRIYDDLGEMSFRAQLLVIDPLSASKIARNDRQRLIRAYEVVRHTGRPLSDWHKAAGSDLRNNDYTFERHLLLPERERLYESCNARFLRMIEAGALQEVEGFLSRGIDPNAPSMKTIGLRELCAFLRGDTSREHAIASAQQSTRNYAKRQMTWFRNQWKC